MIKLWTTAAISILALSASAYAQDLQSSNIGINVEALGGMRWGKADFDTTRANDKRFYRAQEFKVGTSYQIPNTPVAAGVNLGVLNYNNKDTAFDSKRAYEVDATVEAKAWLPPEILPTLDAFVPYAKLAYTPYSAYRQELEEGQGRTGGVEKIQGNGNGYTLGAGANFRIVNNLSGALEYSYSQRNLKTENQATKAKAKNKFASHGALVGVTASM